MARLGIKNIAVFALVVFTTDSSRFASYVTNGLSPVAKEKRDLLNERERARERGGGKEQHRFEFTWQFTFRLGHPNATQIQIGGYWGQLALCFDLTEPTARKRGVSSSRFFFFFLKFSCF